jgi:hypothetical protein
VTESSDPAMAAIDELQQLEEVPLRYAVSALRYAVSKGYEIFISSHSLLTRTRLVFFRSLSARLSV